jgi:DNA-binding response OmpR family regulator
LDNNIEIPNKMPNANSSCRVLIVEDNEEVAIVLKRLLEEAEKQRRIRFDVSITSSVIESQARSDSRVVDIFVVDLGLPDEKALGRTSANVGMRLLSILADKSDCGIIVYSVEAKSAFFQLTMRIGIDDFIEKTDPSEFVVEKIIAVWRRILSARIERSNLEKNRGRSFRIGEWVYTIGKQVLVNVSGNKSEVGITEHEFLKYLVLAHDHSIDFEGLRLFVTRRADSDGEADKKTLENLVYRLRKKTRTVFWVNSSGQGHL